MIKGAKGRKKNHFFFGFALRERKKRQKNLCFFLFYRTAAMKSTVQSLGYREKRQNDMN